jgi:hypothetical protein
MNQSVDVMEFQATEAYSRLFQARPSYKVVRRSMVEQENTTNQI